MAKELLPGLFGMICGLTFVYFLVGVDIKFVLGGVFGYISAMIASEIMRYP